ncbi:copper resistance protein CopC [Kitasatospora griseola]|uniref:copper resistance CopC family protein n=1 Tax=Kitasatospora griseola TaxID=2064 RepID=UPI0013792C4C|nr:copper resistance CopC family protein [Kitasatospora griseola]
MKPRVPSRPAAVPLLTALLLAALSVLAPAPRAQAHAQLLASSPAADSVTAESPTAVTLSFDSPVQPGYTTVAVLGTDGTPYTDGPPTALNGQVQQKLGRLPKGAIQVVWRAVAADGAPLQGRFAFTNADDTAPVQPPPRPSTPAAPPAAVPAAQDSADWPWWAAAGGLSVAAVAAVAVLVRRPSRGR